MHRPKSPLLILPLLALVLSPHLATAAEDPAIEKILPMPPGIRQILNEDCVMCHGEKIAGRTEMRADLDLSSDASIRETLSEAGRLKQMILEEKMPQKAKLSRRLRDDDKLAERLDAIKARYARNGERAKLLAWLKDIVATKGKKHDR